ncbi:Aste57867_18791 [Aphanomyces stellatus]|uniref:sn-1-specific diacylglycerol lipase n=1 Tax=Aphanomyces stellatus TaxID=120398 RepID=A0A485LB83_9STRA|nr:hypothetical protein As57867_018727 [Aphanomyces stellatus]VFT95525.1 Aste57867_18791 [Aphanomyces stellatus]
MMLRQAVRRRFVQVMSAISQQPTKKDPLSMLKIIADATPASLMKMTSADWLLRLTVLARHNSSRPASIAAISAVSTLPPGSANEVSLSDHAAFLNDIRYYVRVCDATYAATEERFLKDSLLADRNATVLKSHEGGVFAPKYYLYLDHDRHSIVLVVRGSASIEDFVTDMCMNHEPFQDGYGSSLILPDSIEPSHIGHRGIVHAAHWLDWKLRDELLKLSEDYPTYDVRLTGHSLGAGAAALVAHIWAPVMPRMHCIVFAPPACLTLGLAEACQPHVTSVILGDDCVPRLSGQNLVQLHDEVEQFDMSAALKLMMAEELEAKAKQTQESASVKQIREAMDRVDEMKKTASETFQTKLSKLKPRRPLPNIEKSWLDDKPFAAELKQLWIEVDKQIDRTQKYLALEPKQLQLVSAWPFKLNDQDQMEWRQRLDFMTSMPNTKSTKGMSKLMSLWGKVDVNVIAMEGLLRFVNDPQRKMKLIATLEDLLRELATARSKFSKLAPLLEPMSNRIYELLMVTKHTLQQTNVVIPMSNNFQTEEIAPKEQPKKRKASSPMLEDKILSMVDGICEELRRETDSILKQVDKSGGKEDAVDELMGMAPVYPPGTVYVLDTTTMGETPAALVHVKRVADYFNHIVVSNDMIMDHLSSTYDEVIIDMVKSLEEK